ERHVRELTEMAAKHGAEIPAEGDMKQMLTTGKVTIAGMTGGDSSLLKAMSSHEHDTISAYESGARNSVIPADDRPLFASADADARRHQAYIDSGAQNAARPASPASVRGRNTGIAPFLRRTSESEHG